MDLLPTQEQQDLANAAAEFLSHEVPPETIRERRNEPAAVPLATWEKCAALGLLGVSLPEADGGAGAGLVEEMLVLREIGRVPAPGPFLSTSLGARLAAAVGDRELTSSITSGASPVGLALPRDTATVSAEGLSGPVYLLDAVEPGLVLVIGDLGSALVHTDVFAGIEPVRSIDPGVRLATASAKGGPLLHYLPAEREDLRVRAMVLAAAQLSGIADATTDASVRHAKLREQFGRPIGVNQAIKHRCADMAVAAEAAMAQTFFAAAALESGRADARFQATTALVVATHAARTGAAANVQIHGGMGYTFEHDANLYVKRAEVWGNLLGPHSAHLDDLLVLPRAV